MSDEDRTGQPCPAGEAARSWLDHPDTPGAEIFGGEGCHGVMNRSGICTTCGASDGKGGPLYREDYPELFEVIRAKASYGQPFKLTCPCGQTPCPHD